MWRQFLFCYSTEEYGKYLSPFYHGNLVRDLIFDSLFPGHIAIELEYLKQNYSFTRKSVTKCETKLNLSLGQWIGSSLHELIFRQRITIGTKIIQSTFILPSEPEFGILDLLASIDDVKSLRRMHSLALDQFSALAVAIHGSSSRLEKVISCFRQVWANISPQLSYKYASELFTDPIWGKLVEQDGKLVSTPNDRDRFSLMCIMYRSLVDRVSKELMPTLLIFLNSANFPLIIHLFVSLAKVSENKAFMFLQCIESTLNDSDSDPLKLSCLRSVIMKIYPIIEKSNFKVLKPKLSASIAVSKSELDKASILWTNLFKKHSPSLPRLVSLLGSTPENNKSTVTLMPGFVKSMETFTDDDENMDDWTSEAAFMQQMLQPYSQDSLDPKEMTRLISKWKARLLILPIQQAKLNLKKALELLYPNDPPRTKQLLADKVFFSTLELGAAFINETMDFIIARLFDMKDYAREVIPFNSFLESLELTLGHHTIEDSCFILNIVLIRLHQSLSLDQSSAISMNVTKFLYDCILAGGENFGKEWIRHNLTRPQFAPLVHDLLLKFHGSAQKEPHPFLYSFFDVYLQRQLNGSCFTMTETSAREWIALTPCFEAMMKGSWSGEGLSKVQKIILNGLEAPLDNVEALNIIKVWMTFHGLGNSKWIYKIWFPVVIEV